MSQRLVADFTPFEKLTEPLVKRSRRHELFGVVRDGDGQLSLGRGLRDDLFVEMLYDLCSYQDGPRQGIE